MEGNWVGDTSEGQSTFLLQTLPHFLNLYQIYILLIKI